MLHSCKPIWNSLEKSALVPTQTAIVKNKKLSRLLEEKKNFKKAKIIKRQKFKPNIYIYEVGRRSRNCSGDSWIINHDARKNYQIKLEGIRQNSRLCHWD